MQIADLDHKRSKDFPTYKLEVEGPSHGQHHLSSNIDKKNKLTSIRRDMFISLSLNIINLICGMRGKRKNYS